MFLLRYRTQGIRNLITASKRYCTVNILEDDKKRHKALTKEKVELFVKLLGKDSPISPPNLNHFVFRFGMNSTSSNFYRTTGSCTGLPYFKTS